MLHPKEARTFSPGVGSGVGRTLIGSHGMTLVAMDACNMSF